MTKIFSFIGKYFIILISYLPFNVLYILSDFIFLLVYYIFKYRRKVVRKNLISSFPEKTLNEIQKIEKEFYRCLCDTIVETTKLYSFSIEELKRRVTVKNSEAFYEQIQKGKSVSIVLAHYLNWEWFVLALPVYIPINTFGIYKPLTNKIFDNFFFKMRSRFGMKMIPMQKIMRVLLNNKNQQFALGIVADQTPSDVQNSYWDIFLNQETPIFLGTEKIAKHFNTSLVFLDVTRPKRGYLEFEFVILADDVSKLDEYEITKIHTAYLENKIRTKPEYWLWSHRRWKHQATDELKKKFIYHDR